MSDAVSINFNALYDEWNEPRSGLQEFIEDLNKLGFSVNVINKDLYEAIEWLDAHGIMGVESVTNEHNAKGDCIISRGSLNFRKNDFKAIVNDIIKYSEGRNAKTT